MKEGGYLAAVVLVDAVVVDSALVAQRDAPLAGTALALAHQEAAVDARAQQVLCGVARDRSVVPRVLLERVDRRHVVGRHPADLAGGGVRLAPFPRLVVAQDPHLLTCKQTKQSMKHSSIKHIKLYLSAIVNDCHNISTQQNHTFLSVL